MLSAGQCGIKTEGRVAFGVRLGSHDKIDSRRRAVFQQNAGRDRRFSVYAKSPTHSLTNEMEPSCRKVATRTLHSADHAYGMRIARAGMRHSQESALFAINWIRICRLTRHVAHAKRALSKESPLGDGHQVACQFLIDCKGEDGGVRCTACCACNDDRRGSCGSYRARTNRRL